MSLDITKLDLYGILGVDETATENDLRKAYRKKAIKCHPDKNPDDPKAAEKFLKLSSALEILCDPTARAAFDKTVKAKKAADARHRELDSKRKKFKEDLEAREKASHNQKAEERAEHKLKAEIERLRKEGSQLLREEQELLKQRSSDTNVRDSDSDSGKVLSRLKLRWNADKHDESNGGYNYDILYPRLHKYGDISMLMVSSSKKGSAIVEFKNAKDAELAVQCEVGVQDKPIKCTWLSGKPDISAKKNFNSESSSHVTSDLFHERDYESLVLMKMRQAEERKRLIEQMQKEEKDQ